MNGGTTYIPQVGDVYEYRFENGNKLFYEVVFTGVKWVVLKSFLNVNELLENNSDEEKVLTLDQFHGHYYTLTRIRVR